VVSELTMAQETRERALTIDVELVNRLSDCSEIHLQKSYKNQQPPPLLSQCKSQILNPKLHLNLIKDLVQKSQS
jgi:hypothetical protein